MSPPRENEIAGANLSGKSTTRERWTARDWAASLVLFCGTSAVVVWQNSRLAVLWDLSYILENSCRTSLGQVPYRDFPFPYAPITFLVQALLIRIAGRAFFHHVIYCAIVGGAGTVLTWRILLLLLRHTMPFYKLVSLLLTMPLTVLGIYCVFPHPFYDPDCTFVILCALLVLLRLERDGFPPAASFLAGIVCVIPLFVKQNTGLGFLSSAAVATAILPVSGARRAQRTLGYAWILAGMLAGLGAAILVLHFTVGIHNYLRWTIEFAAARRLPSLWQMFAAYENPLLLAWFAAFAAGALFMRRARGAKRVGMVASIALMSAPFAWAVLYLFVETDPAERAERLLALWPFVMAISLAFSAWNLGRGVSLARLLPFILLGTIQGAFLSQQLWGSTYAIWPLLIVLFGGILAELAALAKAQASWNTGPWLAGVASVSLFIAGGFYIASHERLDYVNLSDGDLNRSTLPALAGLSMRGRWIPDFEELVRYSDREIPRDEGILMIPGEDLFYYTTGRRPRFPVLMFDRTVNPYDSEQILVLSRSQNICWLVVKKQLQLEGEPVEDKQRLLDLLRGDFTPVRSLANYDVYHRQGNTACADAQIPSRQAN